MRILLMTSLACTLALGACSGGSKNSAAANNAATANGSAASNSSAATGDAAGYRTRSIAECQAGMASANVPAGVNVADVCACGVDRAIAGQANPEAYMKTSQGAQAATQALAACAREQTGAAGAATPKATEEAAEEGAEEAAEEK